jgi:hypothetical protein
MQNRDGEGDSEQPREFRRPRERDFRDRDRDSRDSRDNRDNRESRDSRPPRESREFRDNREGREFRDAGAGEEGQGNGWSGHQPDFLRRASGTGPSGNGRFRRDSRPRGERKSEASGEAQSSDNEPPTESSEDFAAN